MMEHIRRQKIGKCGSKFRYGGGGYQKQPKRFRRLLWTALALAHIYHASLHTNGTCLPINLLLCTLLRIDAICFYKNLPHECLMRVLSSSLALLYTRKAHQSHTPTWGFLLHHTHGSMYHSNITTILPTLKEGSLQYVLESELFIYKCL